MRLSGFVLRLRHLVLLAWILVLTATGGQTGDWFLLAQEAHALFGSAGLHLYALSPPSQAGPVSLVVVRVMDLAGSHSAVVAEVFNALTGWFLVWIAERTAVRVRGLPSADASPILMATTLVLGLLVLQVWGQLSGAFLHVDDALAGTGIALTVLWTAEDRYRAAGVAAGLAVCCKPWALAALPLLLGLRSRRVAAFGAAAAVMVCCWAPFFVADPHSLSAGSFGYPVSPESPVRALGLHAKYSPKWLRDTELIGILLAGSAAARRRCWYAAAAAGLLARLLLDPLTGDLYYYNAVPILCMAGYELAAGGLAWRTPLLAAGMWLDTFVLPLHWLSPVSCATLLVLLVNLCLWPGRHGRSGEPPSAGARADSGAVRCSGVEEPAPV
jgi:hypothetical protein